jgi:predicted amidohydrolase
MIAACGQMEARTMEASAEVWEALARLGAGARQAGADLLLLPETTYPAYWLESAERYRRADILGTAEVLRRYASLAVEHGLWVVAGFVEEQGDRLYNSAAAIDRRGEVVAVARKNFLWDCDNRWFSAGDSISAFDSEFGRIGMLICADCRAPEISATLVHDGATMLLLPTAWVNVSRVRRTYRNIHPEFLIRARAMEFGVPYVCCSKAGREGGHLEYVGQSMVVSADGRELARAPVGGEHLVVAEVPPGQPRVAELDDATRERLLGDAPAYRAASPGGRCKLNPRQPAESVAASLEAAGARTAVLGLGELSCFAAARREALGGTQVLVVRGRAADDVTVRARAAENRVYVVVGAAAVQLVVDPDGMIVYQESDPSAPVELDLARADLKQFTPETDLWKQRRSACYRLGGSPAVCGG